MSPTARLDLADHIRAIPDFPKPGILFRDVTTLVGHAQAFQQAIAELADHFRGQDIDLIAAAEARGFLFAAPLAVALGAGLVPVRKRGKLPGTRLSHTYDLEYGTDTLEIHTDAIAPGQRVLVVDDLLATGGTIEACCKLIEKAGGQVAGCAFVIELTSLAGCRKIAQYDTFSLLKYE